MSPFGRAKVWASGMIAFLLPALLWAPPANCGSPFPYPGPSQMFPGPPPTAYSRPVSYIAPAQSGQVCQSYEAGGRFYYTWNGIQLRRGTGVQIDFVERMRLDPNSVLWEIYGGLRFSPGLTLSYHFVFPHVLQGRAIAPSTLNVGGALFPAGTPITTKATASMNRIESEIYFPVARKFRAGPLISADFVYSNISMASGTVSGSESFTGPQLGIGGVIEYARSSNIFVKAKSAYTILHEHHGFYVDAQVKAFPCIANFTNRTLIDNIQPYLELGYRYNSVDWSLNNKDTVITVIQGVYATLGVIF